MVLKESTTSTNLLKVSSFEIFYFDLTSFIIVSIPNSIWSYIWSKDNKSLNKKLCGKKDGS